MSNLVIVAIPAKNDQVWQISSEKVPHLTLLFLGKVGNVRNVDKILDFLEHAANTMLTPFYLDVEYRGKLGDDEADVVFFEGWDLPIIKNFRASLLQNDAIAKANISEDQFPKWLPHLTLGYPKTPAKKIQDRQIYSVSFDRIALWVDDYEGPEFRLKSPELMEVSMSTQVDDILMHYGKKGMRWGRRKALSAPTNVSVTTIPKRNKQKVITKGGERHPAHSDALTAKVSAQKAKKSGLHSLSNDELQSLAKRLNLEKQVSDLAGDQLASNGQKVVEALMALDKK